MSRIDKFPFYVSTGGWYQAEERWPYRAQDFRPFREAAHRHQLSRTRVGAKALPLARRYVMCQKLSSLTAGITRFIKRFYPPRSYLRSCSISPTNRQLLPVDCPMYMKRSPVLWSPTCNIDNLRKSCAWAIFFIPLLFVLTHQGRHAEPKGRYWDGPNAFRTISI